MEKKYNTYLNIHLSCKVRTQENGMQIQHLFRKNTNKTHAKTLEQELGLARLSTMAQARTAYKTQERDTKDKISTTNGSKQTGT